MEIQPIGFFDSGVGGTSIWKEVVKLLPLESTIYLSDSKNAPYGNKSKKEILNLSKKNTDFLLSENCKLIVVACNTATTNAIGYLRENYKVPFIGIEPAIKPAALQTETKTVGVLATKGTLTSDLFHHTTNLYGGGVKVIETVGTGLVELIEAGKISSSEMRELLNSYLNPMISNNIDYLVLGCSHYPYLIPLIKEILPKHVKIIDSGEAVARQTKNILEKNGLLNIKNDHCNHKLYSNKDVSVLKRIISESGCNALVTYTDF